MDAREWLVSKRGEIRYLERQIQRKLEQKAVLWSRATRSTPSRATAGSSPLPRNNPEESYITAKQRVEEELNALTDRQEDLRLEIARKVGRIPDDASRRLLYMRYARCMEWNDIAARLGKKYSETVRGKMHKRAVDLLQKTQYVAMSIDREHDM